MIKQNVHEILQSVFDDIAATGSPMKIRHWDPDIDGPMSPETVCQRLEAMGYTCTCYTYAPGTIFPEHTHTVDKIDVVIKGRFMINMDGENGLLRDGDYVFIPRGKLHRAAVVGDEDVVSIDATRSL